MQSPIVENVFKNPSTIHKHIHTTLNPTIIKKEIWYASKKFIKAQVEDIEPQLLDATLLYLTSTPTGSLIFIKWLKNFMNM